MGPRTVASYCTTFLKPEMLHIYRQVTALREVRTFVMTKKLQKPARFPFPDIELIPLPRMNPVPAWLAEIRETRTADRLPRRISNARLDCSSAGART